MKRILIVSLYLFLSAHLAWAGAVIPAQQKAQQQRQQQMQQQAQQKNSHPSAYPQLSTAQFEEVVTTMSQVWDELEISSEIWRDLMDDKPKVMIVNKYMSWYRNQGVVIRKPVEHYIKLIDQMAAQNHPMLNQPFYSFFRFLAVIEYDFDNGLNPDEMVLQFLGPAGLEANKRRLGR